ncbi:hypothetical protein A2635_02835 [Candidatus Peribacteria bacterium RIFCSPHIGHO2_01_FULL_51_9]|nr:MAG: hypothetical protein A2635_02835 [Candidatus Peribacteria bacterium RIFCSPHIGHO2_01_FULL_51_9]
MKNWTLILVAVVAGGSFVVGKMVEKAPLPDVQPMTISVTGHGKVSAPPDIAELTFGVTTATLPTTRAAMEDLSKRMNAALDAVKSKGVPVKDVKMVHFSLYEVTHYKEKSNEQVHDGYAASQQLHVKVRDLGSVGDVLQAAISAGANQAGGVQFRIDNPEAFQAEARTQGVAQAKEKAEALASLLGKRLGRLKGYSESSGTRDRRLMGRAMTESADSAPPMPAGEEDVQVTVVLQYELSL